LLLGIGMPCRRLLGLACWVWHVGQLRLYELQVDVVVDDGSGRAKWVMQELGESEVEGGVACRWGCALSVALLPGRGMPSWQLLGIACLVRRRRLCALCKCVPPPAMQCTCSYLFVTMLCAYMLR
jgi:hypothetical protein